MITKVFGIGLHRTGTSTLHRCFQIMGYRSLHYYCRQAYARPEDILARRDPIPGFFDGWDAFVDFPTPWLVDRLMAAFPDSQFVLTVRDIDRWIESVAWHFSASRHRWDDWDHAVHDRTYGIHRSQFEPAICQRVFEAHAQQVQHFFSHHRHRLLVVDVTQLKDWTRLCQFLETDIPRCPIPWLHRRT